jgi:hypothetical protein
LGWDKALNIFSEHNSGNRYRSTGYVMKKP